MSASRFAATFVLLLTVLSSAVRSQVIHINHPNISHMFEPGTLCPITWELKESGSPQFTHADFFLIKFAFDQFFIIHPIAYELDLRTTKSIDWIVPKEDIGNGQYIIGAFAHGADYHAFSDHFWILQDYYYP